MKKSIFCLMVIACVLVHAEVERKVVQRQRALVRSGAGLFYPIIAELSQGTPISVLAEEEGWYKIAVQDSNGYVSTKVTQAASAGDDPFLRMSSGADVRLSRHGMSAGVKGFASRFTTAFKGDADFMDVYASYQLDPADYRAFTRETERRNPPTAAPLHPLSIRDYFSFSEAGMGIAIASRVSQLGLLQDPDIQTYVNCVGTRVASASHGYDVGFRFFVLDVDAANAYACPGGIVFVTRGMLQSLNNEAELAVILGHEIAHVVLRHGMQEMEKRKHNIKSDDAFVAMEEEFEKMGEPTDAEYKAVEEELDAMALEIYDTIYQGRMDAYEVEADSYGTLYAARAGYKSSVIHSLLQRLLHSERGSTNEHYTPEQITGRIKNMRRDTGVDESANALLLTQRYKDAIAPLMRGQ